MAEYNNYGKHDSSSIEKFSMQTEQEGTEHAFQRKNVFPRLGVSAGAFQGLPCFVPTLGYCYI